MTRKLTVLTAFLLSCLLCSAGQPSFRHITTAEGLSHSTVVSIVQDGEGKMWFATHDGLNCYDGYDFTVYRHIRGDGASIAYNYVRSLVLDASGNLWVSDDSAISFYDGTKNAFRNYETPGSHNVIAFSEFSPDKLIVACSDTLLLMDKPSGQFSGEAVPDGIRSLSVRSFASDGRSLLMGTDSGEIYSWDRTSGDIRRFLLGGNGSVVRCILPENGRIWVGTDGGGLFLLDPGTAGTERFSVEDGMVSDHIRTLCRDSQGKLWIGTYEGLDIYDGTVFTHCRWIPSDGVSLSNNSIRCLTCDSQGGVWIGTYYGAINYSHPLRPEFSHYVPSIPGLAFPDNRISFIAQQSDDVVWLANGYSGAMTYNLRTGQATYVKIPGGEEETNDIKAIFADDGNGRIWFGGNFGGLNVLSTRSGILRHYEDLPSGVYSITPKDGNTLYLCTSSGLYLADRRSGTAMPDALFDSRLKVRVIEKDSKGRIWAGGAFGVRLFRDDLNYEDITGPELSGITRVTCLMENSSGQQFIGTDYGLYRYSEEGTVTFFSTADGLPNNVICSISEDAFGLIWISTDNGLCRFNPFTRAFRSYGPKDGLLFPRFISKSACLLGDGRLLLGSSEGMVSFVPESIKDNPFSPVPKVWKAEAAGRLLADPGLGIRMRQGDNPLVLYFSSMNYLSGGRDRFRYRMRGYERNWHQLIGENKAEYLNLPPGRYTFELKAANDEGMWNDSLVKVPVIIRRVWFHSAFDYILLSCLVLILASGAVYMVVTRRRNAGPEPPAEETPEEAFLRSAGEIVDANLANDGFSVTDLARELGISRSGLYDKMKQISGVPVLEFIRHRRFERACQLLKEGNMTVAEVGYAVGFSSPTYFSRAFKNYYGLLPTEYINKFKSKK